MVLILDQILRLKNFKNIIKNKDLEIIELKKQIEELKKKNTDNKKNPVKNVFTIDELKNKTKITKNIVNIDIENDYKVSELSELELSF